MKIGTIRKLYTRLLKRRNKAQREIKDRQRDCTDWDYIIPRLETKVSTLDAVLDDLDRLIANNHDRFHDRRKR